MADPRSLADTEAEVHVEGNALRDERDGWMEKTKMWADRAATLTAERDALRRRVEELEAERG